MFRQLETEQELPASLRVICASVIAVLTLGLIFILVSSGTGTSGLQQVVAVALPESGVSNPVTAVLLNFRSYDTLLEIAVLLVVAVATLPGNESKPSVVQPRPDTPAEPVLMSLVRLLVPLSIIMGGYLLWVGGHAPGGAFQAGALFAGAGVLVSLAGRFQFEFTSMLAKQCLVLGLTVFVLVALLVIVDTGVFLQYPPAFAGVLILLIESAATLSIAATLLLLYSNLARPIAANVHLRNKV